MFLRQFFLGFVFLVTSSFALSNTEFTYNVIDVGIEVTGCVEECPSDLVIPEEIDGYSVTSIGELAFYNKQLTSVNIANSITRVGGGSFKNNQLTSAILGNSVASIGWSAFSRNQLTSIVIPNSVSSIETGAFGYNQLSSITIPDSVISIGKWAFIGNQIISITIPDDDISIEDEAFIGNPRLNSEGWQYFLSSDKAVITGCTDTCPSNLVIPNNIDGYSVNRIGYEAFWRNQLTSVTIPDSVTIIDNFAFWQAELTNVYLADNVTTIGRSAFSGNQIIDINIPNSVTSIGRSAFFGNQLSSIIIPNSLSIIEDKIFSNNQLTTVTIPNSVDVIGDYTFSLNPLTEIIFLGKRPVIGVDVFRDYSWSAISSIYYCSGAAGWPGEPIDGITPQLEGDCTFQDEQYATFDIDQSGSVDALSDGLILLRYFFGLRGDALINNVISPDANRTSAADIEAYIESHMP